MRRHSEFSHEEASILPGAHAAHEDAYGKIDEDVARLSHENKDNVACHAE